MTMPYQMLHKKYQRSAQMKKSSMLLSNISHKIGIDLTSVWFLTTNFLINLISILMTTFIFLGSTNPTPEEFRNSTVVL